MANTQLKEKIRDLLRSGPFAGVDEAVAVSDGEIEPHIHVVVISRKFDDLEFIERQELIWPHLERALSPEEWGQVTLVVGISPQQAKAYS